MDLCQSRALALPVVSANVERGGDLEECSSAGVRAGENEALITLIDEDLGFHLHQAVQQLKFELSRSQSAEFHFRDGSMDLKISVTRESFERWIADDLHVIEECVDSLLETSGVNAGAR